jgi:hypothetical protein
MNSWFRVFRLSPRSLGLLSALLMLLSVAGKAGTMEAIDAVGAHFDFGYVPFGSQIKHRVILINQCDSIVKITRVVPGCGCTQIPLKKKQLAPKESLEVEIILDTGKIQRGLFHKAPTIFTDNMETPRVIINLEGFNLKADETQPLIKLTPNTLHFQKSLGNPVDTVEITNNTPRGITAKLADGPQAPFLSVETPYLQINSGRHDEMIVKLRASGLEEDTMDESITIVFNDLKRTRITIPVSITR